MNTAHIYSFAVKMYGNIRLYSMIYRVIQVSAKLLHLFYCQSSTTQLVKNKSKVLITYVCNQRNLMTFQ